MKSHKVMSKNMVAYLRNPERLMFGHREMGISVERNGDGDWETEVAVFPLGLVHTMVMARKDGKPITALQATKAMLAHIQSVGITLEGDVGAKVLERLVAHQQSADIQQPTVH